MNEPPAASGPAPEADRVVHLIRTAEWDRAQAHGAVRAEPFLHLCTPAQVAGVVARYYQDVEDLLALLVDRAALGPALRWEPGIDPTTGAPAADGELFPHLYGPLALAAVLDVAPARTQLR